MNYGALAALGAIGLTIIGIAQTAKGKAPKRTYKTPFTDKACTKLRDEKAIEAWAQHVGFRRYQKAFDADPMLPTMSHDQQLMLLHRYVTFALATLPVTCWPWDENPARRGLYKGMWCSIAGDLLGRGILGATPQELASVCIDPEFDPQTLIDQVVDSD